VTESRADPRLESSERQRVRPRGVDRRNRAQRDMVVADTMPMERLFVAYCPNSGTGLSYAWLRCSPHITRDQREVCPLSRGVISPHGSIPIPPITGGRSLAPSSSTGYPISAPCDVRSPEGGQPAYHVPHAYHGWSRLRLSAGGFACLRQGNFDPLNRPQPRLSAPLARCR